MQIVTSAVRDLWTAEGVTSEDDLACLYTRPRQVCHHMNEHDLEDAHIDSAVQGWTTARRWVSSWRRFNSWTKTRRGAPAQPC